MALADRRFFGRAWASLASTRNVFGKLCLIALLQFVPVLGQMVTLGYFLGWVREAAWGMETPMPAHVLSGGDRTYWPRAAKAWVTTLLYGLIEGAFVCLLVGVWAFFGHMQTGIVDDIILGVLVAVGLLGSIILLICYYVGLVRLAIYNRFGAAWQWGQSLRMAGRDFGGLLKLFFGTVGLNLLISVLAVAAAGVMVLAFLSPTALSTFVGGVAMLGGATDPEVVLGALVTVAAGLLVASPLLAVLSFLLEIPYLVISAVCWRALGNWAAQFDVARWGAMGDPLPDPAPEPAVVAAPVAPTPASDSAASTPPASPASDPASPACAEQSAALAPASQPGVVDSVGGAGASDAQGAAAPAAGEAADAPSSEVASTTSAQASAAAAATSGSVGATGAAQGYVAPQKRSHPVVIIVLCLVGSLVLSLAVGALSLFGASGMAYALRDSASWTFTAQSVEPEGHWTSVDGQAVTLNEDGTFSWYYTADRSSFASGTYQITDVSDRVPSDAYEEVLELGDPLLADVADELYDLGVTPSMLGVGVYEVTMTADRGMLNGQDATSSAQGSTVRALLVVYGSDGVLVDVDRVVAGDLDRALRYGASDAVLFISRD